MKALSIRQPWAWLIVNGFKDIENRSWPTKFRGRFLVHAAKGMTQAEYGDVASFLDPSVPLPCFEDLERGGIVGAVTIGGCIPSFERTSVWHMAGQYGFDLSGAVQLPFIPCRGALGFFTVPEDVATAAQHLLSKGSAPADRGWVDCGECPIISTGCRVGTCQHRETGGANHG